MSDELTIFQKIIAGEIPGKIEYEDEHCAVLHDINPQAPIHMLVVPKKVIPRLDQSSDDDTELLGHLLQIAHTMAARCGDGEGFRIVINNGRKAGETVPHLHIHVLANRTMHWPPG